jgi:hypothetical protein
MEILNINRDVIRRIIYFYKRRDIVKINFTKRSKTGVLTFNCNSKTQHLHLVSFTVDKRFRPFSVFEFTIRFNSFFYYQYMNEIVCIFDFISFYLKNNSFEIKEKSFVLFPFSLLNKFCFKGFYLIKDPQLGIVKTKNNQIIYLQIILINEEEFQVVINNDFIDNGELYLKKLKKEKNKLYIH